MDAEKMAAEGASYEPSADVGDDEDDEEDEQNGKSPRCESGVDEYAD